MQIVFDIGGTNIRLATSKDGKTLSPMMVFSTPQNFAEALELLKTQITKLAGDEKITSISGGVPAVLDKSKTNLVRVTNLPDWTGQPLATKLSEMFSCPVKLENDAVLAALGEAKFGAGQNHNSVVYVTVGTGIGGAWIVNAKPVEGSYSFDIGHQVIEINGPRCVPCEQLGHLETYIRQPDFKKYLLVGLYNTLLHWPAEIIILGGGVILHNNWSVEDIQTQLRELTQLHTNKVEVKIAALGDEAGVYGALAV